MTRADREAARVLVSVRRAIEERRLVRAGQHVVVACSGGSDSVALTRILARLRPSLGISLGVIGVDHGLRPAAAKELELVAAMADELGLPFRRVAVSVAVGGSLQAAARDARYAALRAHAAEVGASRIAVGHTLDDQAETTLVAALRGKSLHAMGGMAWRRADGIVRPLLAQRRAVLRAWLAAGGHPYVDDPSNADLRFERPRVRALVPSLEAFDPRAIEHLARLADEARGATAAVRARARVWRARAESPAGLRVSVLRAASATVRGEVLRCWLEERAVPSIGRLRELEAVVRAGRGEAVLAPDLCVRVDDGVLGWGTPSGPSRSARGTTSRSDRSSD